MRIALHIKASLGVTITCIIGFVIFGFLQYLYIKDQKLEQSFIEYQDKLNSLNSILESQNLRRDKYLSPARAGDFKTPARARRYKFFR